MRALRSLSRRGRILVASIAALGMLVPAAALELTAAPAASANTPSNWSAVVNGVEFGWTQNHFWVIASYATVITLGSGEVASIVCDGISDGGIGPICDYAVSTAVGGLVSGHPRLTNHGVWAALYPEAWGRYYTTEGTY